MRVPRGRVGGDHWIPQTPAAWGHAGAGSRRPKERACRPPTPTQRPFRMVCCIAHARASCVVVPAEALIILCSLEAASKDSTLHNTTTSGTADHSADAGVSPNTTPSQIRCQRWQAMEQMTARLERGRGRPSLPISSRRSPTPPPPERAHLMALNQRRPIDGFGEQLHEMGGVVLRDGSSPSRRTTSTASSSASRARRISTRLTCENGERAW